MSTLRKSTRDKTQASADAARRTGFVRKSRPSLPRHKLFKQSKGLFNTDMTKARERIAIANATNSPLLRLPAEIRNMIFELATGQKYDDCDDCGDEHCCYTSAIYLLNNKKGIPSASGTSAYASRSAMKRLAISLPRVCRQIYAETATFVYSENCFAFASPKGLEKWLAKRLPAQREAITDLIVPHFGVGGESELLKRVRLICPNLRVLKEAEWLDEMLETRCRCYRSESFDFDAELSSSNSDGERCRQEMIEELYESEDW